MTNSSNAVADNEQPSTNQKSSQSTTVISANELLAKVHDTNKKKKKKEPKEQKKEQEKFPVYLPISDVQAGLEKGELLKGAIRISTKSSQRAFINNEDRSEADYLLQSELDRNRALEGDVVAFQFKPKAEWTKKQKTVVVVHILEKVHSRITVGHLEPMPDNNKQFAMLVPRDYRLPKIRVAASDCPKDFYKTPKKHDDTLFKAKISAWNDLRYAVGSVMEAIGKSTDIQAETVALLVENHLDVTPFPAGVLKDVSICDSVPPDELLHRKDLRSECIFTIDPLTAHDLDDALSCKVLGNGNFEIGVHISDVGFYLTEDTTLDKIACKKATTIYLTNEVYHMLPPELCRQCSFTPGADKLAFSVFWEMTRSGVILRHSFERTVINSCVQLAYEHAQAMIEKPTSFQVHGLPQVFGGFTYKDLGGLVNHLHGIAVILRKRRVAKGALHLGRIKAAVKLDAISGKPCGFCVFEYKDSHKLVEEFMLLANAYVAGTIAQHFPNQAFLRRHPSPNQVLMEKIQKTLQGYGIDIDTRSSEALQFSVLKVQILRKLDSVAMAVLYHLITKAMSRAEYFCSASISKEDFRHYALGMPIYTHFTSPIRRYADVVVHRLLASTLGYNKKRQWKLKHLAEVATNCNRQKYNAKRAGDASSDVYLAQYMAQNCPFIQDAAVVGIGNNYVEVVIPITGTVIRIYPRRVDKSIKCSHKQHVTPRKLVVSFPKTAKFPEEECTIQLFSVLQVIAYRIPKKMQFRAKLWRPIKIRSLL